MDDRILAMCELSNDLIFHKIPSDRMSFYVDSSLNAGRTVARQFVGVGIQKLYHDNNITVTYSRSGRSGYGVILRGQVTMSPKECSVEVYSESIKDLAQHSMTDDVVLTYEDALNVHLAHEFFHFWEYQNGQSIVETLDPITTFSFLGFQRKAHIIRCGEIAAHAFAKTLLDLPNLPNLYDYRYLINTGRMESSHFDQLCTDMAALLNGS